MLHHCNSAIILIQTSSKFLQVVRQILGDLHQMMRDNPQRRHTYGITMVNFQTRFWYRNRSEVVVSPEFHFMKVRSRCHTATEQCLTKRSQEYKNIIRWVVSLAFGKAHELGYDTSMRAVSGTTRGQYDIVVRDEHGKERVFRAYKLLYSVGAEALRGRGTRVWEAIEIVDGAEVGSPVALKDTWIDSGRDREGDIIETIRAAACKSSDPDALLPHLPEVVCHGYVYVAEQKDTTRIPTATWYMETTESPAFDSSTQAKNASILTTIGSSSPLKPAGNNKRPREYEPKDHYRIVSRDVGCPLRDVPSLYTVFEALRQACGGRSRSHARSHNRD